MCQSLCARTPDEGKLIEIKNVMLSYFNSNENFGFPFVRAKSQRMKVWFVQYM